MVHARGQMIIPADWSDVQYWQEMNEDGPGNGNGNANGWNNPHNPHFPVVPEPEIYGTFMIGTLLAFSVLRRKKKVCDLHSRDFMI